MLEVHDRLRLSGGAGAVEPEGHVIFARGGDCEVRAWRDLIGAQHPRGAGGSVHRGLELLLGIGVDDDHPGKRVLDEVVVVLAALKQRIDGHRHGSEAYRSKKGGNPTGSVVADDEHPFLTPDAEVVQLVRGTARELEQVSVGDVFGGGGNRELVRTPGVEVALEQVGADVVALRQLHPRSV